MKLNLLDFTPLALTALVLGLAACAGHKSSPGGEEGVREDAVTPGGVPATPVVIYLKAEPTDTDLDWLRTNGFVVDKVTGKTVFGYFERNPPPEFKDDPRIERIVPLQKPPGR